MSERCQKDAGAEGSFSFLEEVGSEELREGARLERGPPLLRKKVKENWTEKHRNVARKIFLEGGWTQNRLFDIGWSDVSQCQACQMEEGTEKHRLYHCPEWYEVRREILSQRGSKKREPQSQSNRGHLRNTRTGACQEKGSKATLRQTALFWVQLESGELVAGLWCSWIMMKNWGPCMGCSARWKQSLRSSAPSRGRS